MSDISEAEVLGDTVIQEALTSGTDLREYSQKLEDKLKKVCERVCFLMLSSLIF